MSIRTTVTLDEDVLERVRQVSRSRGTSFRQTLNDLLRAALASSQTTRRRRTLTIKATHMGCRAGLNYDDIESLLSYSEGETHR